MPRVVAPLEPLELGQRRGRGLVEQQRHGFRLLGLGHEHGVAAQHHGLVLHLVPVDPGEDLGQPRVGHAVGDPVQQVQVSRAPRLVVHVHHADALRADRQTHLGAVLAHLALAPDLAHRHVRAAVALGLDGGGVAQVEHRVGGVLAGDLHLFPLGFEHAAHPVERALRARLGEGGERRVVEAHRIALLLGPLVFLDQVELVLLPGQHLTAVSNSDKVYLRERQRCVVLLLDPKRGRGKRWLPLQVIWELL